ncbi:hypothetical protein HW452_05205 [Halomonas aquamarina]|uniref:Uncharacterized protein n=1 Tax=Vreelandella aquamarina TaxID=77097 RepID=A0ACC5VT67_9GAMM|nr:hypothetical protein [Halomonas aquamarina]MBZ5486919.1 hypothetical protein [Halomonas aquamarina]
MNRIRLTEDAKVWHRLWSNQATLLAAVTLLQGLLPFWEGVVPGQWFQAAGAVLASAAFVLRNIEQPGLKRGRDDDQ